MKETGEDKATTTDKQNTTENRKKDDKTIDMKQNRSNANEADVQDDENTEQSPEKSRDAEGKGKSKDELESVKEELDTVKQEAAETYDRLLRMTADFENYKKRSQRDREDQKKFANESLIKDLLPVIDNLERALVAAKEQQSSDAGHGGNMVEGVEMTLNEIVKILKDYNVTAVEAQGKPFDPTYHEAVMQEESDQYPENTVINELQKGYMLHDRLIRPAMVVVSKGGSSHTNETE
ncbi:MAG: nucleotide exchange factor GrpE [Thermodesulfobacteriota bacterium]